MIPFTAGWLNHKRNSCTLIGIGKTDSDGRCQGSPEVAHTVTLPRERPRPSAQQPAHRQTAHLERRGGLRVLIQLTVGVAIRAVPRAEERELCDEQVQAECGQQVQLLLLVRGVDAVFLKVRLLVVEAVVNVGGGARDTKPVSSSVA